MTDRKAQTAYVDGKPVAINVPKDYGKEKPRKVAKFKLSAGSLLRAAIAKGNRL